MGVGTSVFRKIWKANPDGEGNRLESVLVRKGWGSTPLSSAEVKLRYIKEKKIWSSEDLMGRKLT